MIFGCFAMCYSSLAKSKILVGSSRHYAMFVCRYNSTLETVGVDDVSDTMHDHSAASFLSPFLIPIFRVHLFDWKIAVLILKSTMVDSKKFTKYLTLDLLHKIIDRIAVYKGSFFGIVSMQVEVEREAIVFDEVVC